ncbi:MAG: hypothetical protein ACLGI5_06025 [Thermoleophilia bacterium]
MSTTDDKRAIFNSLARIYTGRLDIKLGTAFGGGPALSSSGTLFAALPGEELIVRLPPQRCAQLVDAGQARLYTGDGQTHEDWIVVPGDDAAEWEGFVTEALGCARG